MALKSIVSFLRLSLTDLHLTHQHYTGTVRYKITWTSLQSHFTTAFHIVLQNKTKQDPRLCYDTKIVCNSSEGPLLLKVQIASRHTPHLLNLLNSHITLSDIFLASVIPYVGVTHHFRWQPISA